MNTLTLKASALALAVFTGVSAQANVVNINFDNIASGATASSAAPTGVEFSQAHYVNDVDSFGDEIPNTEKWQIDSFNNTLFPVTAENPALLGYGSAPSGNNALDARWQPVIMRFSATQNLQNFAVTLDSSSYGNLSSSSLYFLNSSKAIIGQIDFDQTVAGLILNLNSPLDGVWEVVFSEGAFYDNISYAGNVAPVPVPPAALMFGSALLGLLGLKRKSVLNRKIGFKPF